jgi:hypothetical protein
VQNENISLSVLLNKLAVMMKSADCLSVGLLADEIADTISVEQFSTGVRNTCEDKIREDFLKFEPLTDVMGCDLVETLLECLQRYGLKMEIL